MKNFSMLLTWFLVLAGCSDLGHDTSADHPDQRRDVSKAENSDQSVVGGSNYESKCRKILPNIYTIDDDKKIGEGAAEKFCEGALNISENESKKNEFDFVVVKGYIRRVEREGSPSCLPVLRYSLPCGL